MDNRYCFKTEWYEDYSEVTRPFNLIYYPADETVELNDTKNKKTFLSRTKCKSLLLSDIFIGNTVNIYSRNFKIVDYADEYTKKTFLKMTETCVVIVRKNNLEKAFNIIDYFEQNYININGIKMFSVDQSDLDSFLSEIDATELDSLSNIVNNTMFAIQVSGQDCVRLVEEMGRTGLSPDYYTNCNNTAQKMSALLFGSNISFMTKSCAKMVDTTLCLIKPHILREGKLGQTLKYLNRNNVEINALKLYKLNQNYAGEFYQVYRTVLVEYVEMVNELTSGPFVAIEINLHVEQFRKLVGPFDPEIAKSIFPSSMRACFGTDRIKNAIHCTDLPEDGQLEVKYFFDLLWGN